MYTSASGFSLQPALQRFEALEDRRPRRVLLFMMIDREADSRGMRDGDTAENVSHQITPLIGVRGDDKVKFCLCGRGLA